MWGKSFWRTSSSAPPQNGQVDNHKSESEVAQSCSTLCNPVDRSPAGFSAHGLFRARTPKWTAIPCSRGSSLPRDGTQMSSTVDRHHLSHREARSTNWRTIISGGGRGQQWPATGSGTLTTAVTGRHSAQAKVLLEKVTIIPVTVWPQAKLQGGNTTPPISRKLDLRFTEHCPAHQSKTQFSPWPVLPIRKLTQEGRQNENHNHSKLTKLITWITTLCSLKKL